MPSYIPVNLELKPDQLRKLFTGQSVTLKKDQLEFNGENIVVLTAQQIRKINTAKKKNKGLRLKLSVEQLEKQMKEGGSLMDWLKSAYKHIVKPNIRGVLKSGAETLINKIDSPKLMKDMMKTITNSGIDSLGDASGGYGIYPSGYNQETAGKGINPAGYGLVVDGKGFNPSGYGLKKRGRPRKNITV